MRLFTAFLFCLVFGFAQEKRPEVANLANMEYGGLARQMYLQGSVSVHIKDPSSKEGWIWKEPGHPLLNSACLKHMQTWWYKNLQAPTDVRYNFKLISNDERNKEGWCVARSGFSDKTEHDVWFLPEARDRRGRVVMNQVFFIRVMIKGPCLDTIR